MSKNTEALILDNSLDRVIVLVNNTSIMDTRIQKYGFWAAKRYHVELQDLNFYVNWRTDDNNPHSDELERDIKMCIKENMVIRQVEKEPNGNTIHIYSLTDDGKHRLEKLKIHAKTINAMNEKFSELNRCDEEKIMNEIYSLSHNMGKNNTETDRERLHKQKIETRRLNESIEEMIKSIQSGESKGKRYTVPEYLKHVDQILEN